MRVTRKMMNDNSIYNINANKEYMDKVNTQMASQKKYVDPSDDPVTAIRALRFQSNLSEVTQFLDRNVSDAISWTESTQTSIDTARELMRSLKSEYTSAANGTNEIKDLRIYYQDMKNLVDEYYSIGNASSEDRHIFTGYRTQDSLTFTDEDFENRQSSIKDGKFKYVGIKETFGLEDLESYSFTVKKDTGTSGITDDEIINLDPLTHPDETQVISLENMYRMRLSYENLDKDQVDAAITYKDKDGKEITTDVLNLQVSDRSTTPPTPLWSGAVEQISSDLDLIGDLTADNELPDGKIYLNTTTGNLIFGKSVQGEISNFLSEARTNSNIEISFQYNKSEWLKGDVKPEYYFNCVDIGMGAADSERILYNDHEQAMNYHMGDSQDLKVNANACDVFTLDARRDLDEIYDYLNLMDSAQSKVDRLTEMKNNTTRYPSSEDQATIQDLLAAANKELEYALKRVNEAFSTGMTKSGKYFDFVNMAGTEMGTAVKRLELIKTRLTEDKTTVQTQTSNNENIDLSTLTVDLSEATLSYNAALQVTGKISQQTLVSYI
ncbi:MAG: hypothetical protein IJU87_08100 [Lachnospiraceae bacterium]|nr:hypothetical protein [Lachnospiraceae bacterium]